MTIADQALLAYRAIQLSKVGMDPLPTALRARSEFFSDNAIVAPDTSLSSSQIDQLRELSDHLKDVPSSSICGATSSACDAFVGLGWYKHTSDLVLMGQLVDRLPQRIARTSGPVVEIVASDAQLDQWLATAVASGWNEYRQASMVELVRTHLHKQLDDLGSGALTQYWIARVAGQPAGIAAAIFYDDFVIFDLIGVLAKYRRSGIARHLIQTRVDAARRRGSSKIYLLPTEDGRGLYTHLGFDISSPEDYALLVNGEGEMEFDLYFSHGARQSS